VHIGHSTGGEVVHYIARHGESRVAKAAIMSAVPPLMVKTANNPGDLPKDVFDGLQTQLATKRCGVWTVLWLQPAWRETLSGGDLELVAPGHDGRCQGAL
jgi:hypothetical protein